MLNSPKMQRIQRSVRINEGQLLGLAEKARWVRFDQIDWNKIKICIIRYDCVVAGHLYKRCSDSNKWLIRWFRLYQVHVRTRDFRQQCLSHFSTKNLLFYYDGEQSSKPAGVIFLEVRNGGFKVFIRLEILNSSVPLPSLFTPSKLRKCWSYLLVCRLYIWALVGRLWFVSICCILWLMVTHITHHTTCSFIYIKISMSQPRCISRSFMSQDSKIWHTY